LRNYKLGNNDGEGAARKRLLTSIIFDFEMGKMAKSWKVEGKKLRKNDDMEGRAYLLFEGG